MSESIKRKSYHDECSSTEEIWNDNEEILLNEDESRQFLSNGEIVIERELKGKFQISIRKNFYSDKNEIQILHNLSKVIDEEDVSYDLENDSYDND